MSHCDFQLSSQVGAAQAPASKDWRGCDSLKSYCGRHRRIRGRASKLVELNRSAAYEPRVPRARRGVRERTRCCLQVERKLTKSFKDHIYGDI